MTSRVQSLFQETKSVCFGRFLIDIPKSATVVFGPAEAGPFISYLSGQGHEIPRRVAEDIAAASNSRKYFDEENLAQLPLLGKVIDGAVLGQKITFDTKTGVGYYINSYVPVGHDLFVQHISNVMHEDYNAAVFNDVASHLRLRAADEIPAEPGSCIAGGFLPVALEYERVRIGVRLKEFPDVHLSVDVHKNREKLETAASLELTLQEGAELAKAQGHGDAYARITTLRRGARQLGTWDGYEMVARKPADNDNTEAHEFHFHSLGAPHDPLKPQIDIRLDTGVNNNRTARTKPSLTDEEAIALWDKLIGTIRVRQTTDVKPSHTTPAKVPLGKLTATGDLCTQKGWWQCVEGGEVEGGRRRLFVEGEPMPHAVLLGKPNLWQKLMGERPKYSLATVWKLVDIDTAPTAPSLIADASPPLAVIAPVPPLLGAEAAEDVPPSVS